MEPGTPARVEKVVAVYTSHVRAIASPGQAVATSLHRLGDADELDAGVPARGLHGEGCRGHIFWDELFVYSILTLRRSDLSRVLLGYRYRRLNEARAAAAAAGFEGAMFPWQSANDGREETPTELFKGTPGNTLTRTKPRLSNPASPPVAPNPVTRGRARECHGGGGMSLLRHDTGRSVFGTPEVTCSRRL